MLIGNLMDKLQAKDPQAGTQQPAAQTAAQGAAAPAGIPPVPVPQAAQQPAYQSSVPSRPIAPAAQKMPQAMIFRQNTGGRVTMRDDDNEGIIIDLGEGISLNIPIQKRMSLGDFLKVAEKVKALEMLSEDIEHKKNY